MRDSFQYKGHLFTRGEHCPTCSDRKAQAKNSTATISFGDKCNHQKTTVIMLHYAKPLSIHRQASEAEKAIINRDYNL